MLEATNPNTTPYSTAPETTNPIMQGNENQLNDERAGNCDWWTNAWRALKNVTHVNAQNITINVTRVSRSMPSNWKYIDTK